MIPALYAIAVVSYVILFGCEGRPRSLPKKESEPDIGVTPEKDGGVVALDAFDASTTNDAEILDAGKSDAGIADAGDTFDAGSDVTDVGITDAGFSDAGDVFDAGTSDAGTGQALACQDLEVLLDEFSCVTDPQTISLFGSELPRRIKVVEFTSWNPDVVGCPARDALLHADNQPLFISLMADRDSIPTLQSNPDATLSQFAEDFMSTINGVHTLVPTDGFIEGAVGVWRPEPNPSNGPFIFDAAIEGFYLIYGMPGYSCNYQVSSPWELNQ